MAGVYKSARQVTEAQLPAKNGVLAGHAPLVSALGEVTLTYFGSAETKPVAITINGGVVEV